MITVPAGTAASISVSIPIHLSTGQGATPENTFKSGKADLVPLYIPFNSRSNIPFCKEPCEHRTETVSCIWSREREIFHLFLSFFPSFGISSLSFVVPLSHQGRAELAAPTARRILCPKPSPYHSLARALQTNQGSSQ